MSVRRKKFDKEFKKMAVELCQTQQNRPKKEIAQELGITDNMLNRWVREHDKYGDNSFAGQGRPVMTDKEKELAQLRKELRETQIERDILKKAVSIFSKGDSRNTNS
ncbi:transposase [Salinivirga cyanobacteriivorans]